MAELRQTGGDLFRQPFCERFDLRIAGPGLERQHGYARNLGGHGGRLGARGARRRLEFTKLSVQRLAILIALAWILGQTAPDEGLHFR